MPSLSFKNGSSTISLKLLPHGQGNSGMGGIPRIKIGSQIYDISVVETTAVTASPIRIKTTYGIKALELEGSVYHVALTPSSEGNIDGPMYVLGGSNPQYTVTAHCGSIAHVYLDYGTGSQQDLGAHSSPYNFNPFPNISGDHTITAEFSTTPGFFAIGFDVDHQGIMYTPEPCTFIVDDVQYAPDAAGNYATACLSEGKHSFMATPAVIHVESDYGYHPILRLEYGSNTYSCNPAVINITASGVVRAIYDTVDEEPAQSTIAISEGDHGTIYPNPSAHTIQALQGESATFSVIPDSGYQVASASFGGQTVSTKTRVWPPV